MRILAMALLLSMTVLLMEALAPRTAANDVCPERGPVDASVVNAVCR